MRNLKQVTEERTVKLDRISALGAIIKTENRNWTSEETSEFEKLEGEVRTLASEITTLKAQESAQSIIAARAAGTGVQGNESEGDKKDIAKYSLRKALLSLTDRNARLDGIELEMHQEAEIEMQRFGKTVSNSAVAMPESLMSRMYEKRDITVATGNGSYAVENLVNGYVEALREKSLALQLGAQYLTGLVGNFDMPRENALYTPAFKTENASAVESNPTLAKASFSPKRLTGFMDVSKQLLIQSAIGIEALLRNQILAGHAEALDSAAWNGAAASDQPVGVLNDADVPVLAIGTDGGAITKILIETLIQRLEEAKGMNDNTKFITSPILKRLLKALTRDSGSGQFVWGQDNTVDGIMAFATTHIPKNIAKGTGTNLTAVILGDMANTMFGQWGGTEILVDPYTQAINGLIRFVPVQYVDFHVLQPGRFQVIKDITTA